MSWFNILQDHFTAHPMQLTMLLVIISFSKSTIFISSILPPASVVLPIGISAGLLVVPTWVIWIAISIGAIAGSAFNFYLGYTIKRVKILNHFFLQKHSARLSMICEKLYNNAALTLFVSRFIAVLRYLVPLAAGMLRINPTKVYCISIVSAVLWSALYISSLHLFLSLI